MSSQDVLSLGLAHEVEVVLRKAGATRTNFWIRLSEDQDLAQRVVDFVKSIPWNWISPERYKEIVDKINAYSKCHGGFPLHCFFMEFSDEDVIKDAPPEIKKEIPKIVEETGIPLRDLRKWAFEYDSICQQEQAEEQLYEQLPFESWADDEDDLDDYDEYDDEDE